MLLTKLAKSGKATFWSQRLGKGTSKEILLASEALAAHHALEGPGRSGTVLDILVARGSGGLMAGTVDLSDGKVKDLLDENGLEMETNEEACAILANLLVEACNQDKFRYKDKGATTFDLLLRTNVDKMTLEIDIEFRKTFQGHHHHPHQRGGEDDEDGCPADYARLLGIFSREPRKEPSKKRGSSQQGASQVTFSSSLSSTQPASQYDGDEAGGGSQQSPQRASKVVIRVAEKKKKKLKV